MVDFRSPNIKAKASRVRPCSRITLPASVAAAASEEVAANSCVLGLGEGVGSPSDAGARILQLSGSTAHGALPGAVQAGGTRPSSPTTLLNDSAVRASKVSRPD